MLLVGLTGGIASGKSTVSALLAARGAVVIDADEIARRIIEPGGEAHAGVVAAFGPGIVHAGGSIDRDALAKLVFENPERRLELESLTHPIVMAQIAQRIDSLRDTESIVVCDIPLLTEAIAGKDMFDVIVVVEAGRQTQVDRLATARGYTEEQALARIGAQASPAERRSIADHVIVNDQDLTALEKRVDEVWSALQSARRS